MLDDVGSISEHPAGQPDHGLAADCLRGLRSDVDDEHDSRAGNFYRHGAAGILPAQDRAGDATGHGRCQRGQLRLG